jgi:hypothetical protein
MRKVRGAVPPTGDPEAPVLPMDHMAVRLCEARMVVLQPLVRTEGQPIARRAIAVRFMVGPSTGHGLRHPITAASWQAWHSARLSLPLRHRHHRHRRCAGFGQTRLTRTGTGTIAPDSARNLVFVRTGTHGRSTKGMPNWSGIRTQAQFRDVLVCRHSIEQH